MTDGRSRNDSRRIGITPRRRVSVPITGHRVSSALATKRAGLTVAIARMSRNEMWLATIRPAPAARGPPKDNSLCRTRTRMPIEASNKTAIHRTYPARADRGSRGTRTPRVTATATVVISATTRQLLRTRPASQLEVDRQLLSQALAGNQLCRAGAFVTIGSSVIRVPARRPGGAGPGTWCSRVRDRSP